jgi:hypothetical protein
MKIFDKNLKKNTKKVNLNTKLTILLKMKYLPAFSREWKNTIYNFNKNNLKNLPSNNININNLIKDYFNLFFKNHKYLGITKFIRTRKRRNLLKKIYASNVDIKHTNDKAKITLYIINKERKALKAKYYGLYKKLTFTLFKNYTFLYNLYLKNVFFFLDNKQSIYNEYFFAKDYINKKNYIQYKFEYLNIFIKLNNIALEKIWFILMKNISFKYFKYLRKYSLLYSLNQFKINKSTMLSKLTFFLEKFLGKKLEYNIVNLKSITYHPDIFTSVLALKVKKDKTKPNLRIFSVLNKANIPMVNTNYEKCRIRVQDKFDIFRNKYKDLKIISYIKYKNFPKLLDKIYKSSTIISSKKFISKKKIHKLIFDSIKYKNLNGIRLEVSGRLTKRYRADKAIKQFNWKGGLKNIHSSFQGLNSVLFRGNTGSNISYSLSKSKRRIGSFAVKGWISAK